MGVDSDGQEIQSGKQDGKKIGIDKEPELPGFPAGYSSR
jgi:hypothetical protein